MYKYLTIFTCVATLISCNSKKVSEYERVLRGISTASIDSAILYHDTEQLIKLVKADITNKIYILDINNILIKRFDSIMILNGGKVYGKNTGIWIYSDYVYLISSHKKCYYPPDDSTCYFELTEDELKFFGCAYINNIDRFNNKNKH